MKITTHLNCQLNIQSRGTYRGCNNHNVAIVYDFKRDEIDGEVGYIVACERCEQEHRDDI